MTLVSLALGLVLVTSTTLRAQQPPAQSDEELAKQLANPIASLVSLPLQFNWDGGVGPDEGLRSIVNFQPVLPMRAIVEATDPVRGAAALPIAECTHVITHRKERQWPVRQPSF